MAGLSASEQALLETLRARAPRLAELIAGCADSVLARDALRELEMLLSRS
jgi:hypothetical protein